MSTMRVVQVSEPGGALKLVERKIPAPGAGSVRIKVQACGICHSDALTKDGGWPGMAYPRVPGHEIAGIIDAVGAGVAEWTPGQRVGVGWHGGHCGYCDSCRRGDFVTCQIAQQIPGISVRRRLRRIHDRSRRGPGADPGRAFSRRRGADDVRGDHHLQCASQQRRPARRYGRRARRGRARAFGCSVRREDGFQDRRHRARPGQGTAGQGSSARGVTSIARRRTLRRNWASWAAPRSFSQP